MPATGSQPPQRTAHARLLEGRAARFLASACGKAPEPEVPETFTPAPPGSGGAGRREESCEDACRLLVGEGTDVERLHRRLTARFAKVMLSEIRDPGRWLLGVALPRWGCGYRDCEAGVLWSTGKACEVCAEIVEDKAAARRRAQRIEQGLCPQHGTRPGPAGHCADCVLDGAICNPASAPIPVQREPAGPPRGSCGDCGARIIVVGRALDDGLRKLCREEAAVLGAAFVPAPPPHWPHQPGRRPALAGTAPCRVAESLWSLAASAVSTASRVGWGGRVMTEDSQVGWRRRGPFRTARGQGRSVAAWPSQSGSLWAALTENNPGRGRWIRLGTAGRGGGDRTEPVVAVTEPLGELTASGGAALQDSQE